MAIYTSSAVLWFVNWIIIFHLHTQTRCPLLYWKSINVLNKWCSDYISRINNWLMWFQIDTEIVNFHRIFSYCNAHTSALAYFRSFIIKLNLFKFWITHWRLHTLHRKKCHVRVWKCWGEKIIWEQFKCNCIMHMNVGDDFLWDFYY